MRNSWKMGVALSFLAYGAGCAGEHPNARAVGDGSSTSMDRPEAGVAPAPHTAPPPPGGSVTHKTLTQTSPAEVKIEYPHFTLADAGASVALDKAIEGVVEREVRDFLATQKAAAHEDPEMAKGWVLEVVCHETHLASTFATIVCTRYADTAGAHPSHSTYSLNYAWDGGAFRPLKLADLFTPGSGWETALEKYYTDELGRQRAGWVLSGEFAVKPKDLHTWALTPKGLRIQFDPYDAGPYVEGDHTVVVPWSELRPYVAPRGPAAEFIKP